MAAPKKIRGPLPIYFPRSSSPGREPGEGTGALVNAYCEPGDDGAVWKRAPGLTPFVHAGLSGPRGMIDVGGTLYAAFLDKAVTVSSSGGLTVLNGDLFGNAPVTWARNNRAPVPDVVCVTELGAFSVSSVAVSAFADPDLPQPNSCCSLDGYVVFSTRSGQLWATDLNGVTVPALSFAKAEAKPDGLLRVVSFGGLLYAFGDTTIEVAQNVGTSPYPFQRIQTVPVGLAGQWAIAGDGDGWDQALIFVAADGTVRRLDGLIPTRISTSDVERDIQGVADRSLLRASVYVVNGRPIWQISGPTFTWCFDAASGLWHQRRSHNQVRWRAQASCYFANRWIVGDLLSTNLHAVNAAAYDEAGEPLVWSVEGLTKSFPLHFAAGSAWFDFTVKAAGPDAAEDLANPQVSVRWSKNGGATWSNAMVRRPLGAQGDFTRMVRVNRVPLGSHHGLRWRLEVDAAVYLSFRGGNLAPDVRA